MATEQTTTPPTGADAFEPDWERIKTEWHHGWISTASYDTSLMIAFDEYRHQLAASGWALMRTEDIIEARAMIDVYVCEPVLAIEMSKRKVLRSLDAALAAAADGGGRE